MDNLKDKSIHFTAQTISEEIRQMPMYRGFYNEVQVCHVPYKVLLVF
jgi:hypothetical protein